MKLKFKASVLMVCLVGAISVLASDGFIGTWKLNEAKSKIAPGTAKNTTVVYADQGDMVKVTIDGTDADGKPAHNEWVGRFDGKEYPVSGSATESSRALKKVNDHTIEGTTKQGSGVLKVHIVLSPDGKTRTVTLTGTGTDGKKVQSVAVYDKQ
jgi:hypothetical protein